MKKLSWIVAMGFLVVAGTLSFAQDRGGRYDQQISSNLARVLLSDKDYKDVSVDVEDGIVTLKGSVALDSTRRNLEAQVRHIPHVAGVVNVIDIAPPNVPDTILYGRVMVRLQDAGYDKIAVQVHQGTVILRGNVRTQRDWHWIREVVMLTPGVKEVESRLTVVTP